VIALAFRENRIKNRDLWDIVWLSQQGIGLPVELIPLKIRDHQRTDVEFISLLDDRITALKSQPAMRADFMKEMRRFLPTATVRDTIEKETFWTYLTGVVEDLVARAVSAVR
jgi:hypothetical protein